MPLPFPFVFTYRFNKDVLTKKNADPIPFRTATALFYTLARPSLEAFYKALRWESRWCHMTEQHWSVENV